MNAFHTNWTEPFFARNPGRAYSLADYELLTIVLSALEWRRHNGSIRMITGPAGADYYRLTRRSSWICSREAAHQAPAGGQPVYQRFVR
jgi:hypothetical protein